MERPKPGTAVRLAFALWRFWQQRGYLDEARGLLERMAEQGWQLEHDLRARVAETVGGVAYWQADLPAATRWYDAALEIWHHDASAGDLESRRELARALYNRGFMTVAEVIQASTEGATPDLAATKEYQAVELEFPHPGGSPGSRGEHLRSTSAE